MVQVIVEYDYEAGQPDELTIKKGDIISDVKKTPGGWWEGTLNGMKGVFPDNFVTDYQPPAGSKPNHRPPPASSTAPVAAPGSGGGKVHDIKNMIGGGIKVGPPPKMVKPQAQAMPKNTAVVIFDYKPEQPDELELMEGDMIEVVKMEEEGWWEGMLRGKKGMFPSNFVKLVEQNGSAGSGPQQQQQQLPPPAAPTTGGLGKKPVDELQHMSPPLSKPPPVGSKPPPMEPSGPELPRRTPLNIGDANQTIAAAEAKPGVGSQHRVKNHLHDKLVPSNINKHAQDKSSRKVKAKVIEQTGEEPQLAAAEPPDLNTSGVRSKHNVSSQEAVQFWTSPPPAKKQWLSHLTKTQSVGERTGNASLYSIRYKDSSPAKLVRSLDSRPHATQTSHKYVYSKKRKSKHKDKHDDVVQKVLSKERKDIVKDRHRSPTKSIKEAKEPHKKKSTKHRERHCELKACGGSSNKTMENISSIQEYLAPTPVPPATPSAQSPTAARVSTPHKTSHASQRDHQSSRIQELRSTFEDRSSDSHILTAVTPTHCECKGLGPEGCKPTEVDEVYTPTTAPELLVADVNRMCPEVTCSSIQCDKLVVVQTSESSVQCGNPLSPANSEERINAKLAAIELGMQCIQNSMSELVEKVRLMGSSVPMSMVSVSTDLGKGRDEHTPGHPRLSPEQSKSTMLSHINDNPYYSTGSSITQPYVLDLEALLDVAATRGYMVGVEFDVTQSSESIIDEEHDTSLRVVELVSDSDRIDLTAAGNTEQSLVSEPTIAQRQPTPHGSLCNDKDEETIATPTVIECVRCVKPQQASPENKADPQSDGRDRYRKANAPQSPASFGQPLNVNDMSSSCDNTSSQQQPSLVDEKCDERRQLCTADSLVSHTGELEAVLSGSYEEVSNRAELMVSFSGSVGPKHSTMSYTDQSPEILLPTKKERKRTSVRSRLAKALGLRKKSNSDELRTNNSPTVCAAASVSEDDSDIDVDQLFSTLPPPKKRAERGRQQSRTLYSWSKTDGGRKTNQFSQSSDSSIPSMPPPPPPSRKP